MSAKKGKNKEKRPRPSSSTGDELEQDGRHYEDLLALYKALEQKDAEKSVEIASLKALLQEARDNLKSLNDKVAALEASIQFTQNEQDEVKDCLATCEKDQIIQENELTLIPKPNKDTTVLDNLRPISLLNTDYKILTKVIAKRLEKVLPKIINPDQSGYIKNRYIGENVRLTSDIMKYTEENNIPGIALFLDFKKAFDTIEWDFINSCLKKFNFGPDIQNWVKILYNNVSSCVLNNGFASEFFSVERGVRQGCPLSGLLFVIGIEILARAIKNDSAIKGIHVGEKEIKVSLYADDTTAFVRDLDSVDHLLTLLDNFKNLSGLEINTTKSEGLWLGRWKNKTETPFGFRWPRDPIKALGIFFSYDINKTNELNFAEKIRNLEKTLNSWKRRNLTLYGKINIVKTFGLSKLIYNTSVLVIPENFVKEIDKLIFNFIWDGKPAKIKKINYHW